MLVDREPSYSVVRVSSGNRFRGHLLSRSAARSVATFFTFLCVILALQVASGAYRAEFSGYPDEPAHYITSLMVHDYITGLHWSAPLQFAEQYYHYYPKVAFGHWPPLFYFVQGIWMTLFSTSRASIRVEIAVTTAALAYSVYVQAKKWFSGWLAPVFAGLLTIAIPVMQTYMDEEMAETLLALMCFWAAVYWGRFLETECWRDAILFAVFFSLAVLTKGNGWLLAGLVPIGVVLTRKFGILLRSQFWTAAGIVAFACLPWQILTLHMAEQGWTAGNQPSIDYTLAALTEFGAILLRLAGIPLGLLALAGIVVTAVIPAVRGRVRSGPAAMFGLIVCTWVFHALVPAGVEDRKMLIAVPPLVLLVFSGGYWLADRLRSAGPLARWTREIVTVAGILAFAISGFGIPKQTHYGYDEAARFITSRPDLSHDTILVSDDSIGEGLLISEVAMNEKRPGNLIIRGTKALADMTWNASQYRCLYTTPEQVEAAIRNLHVDLVVVSNLKGIPTYPHNDLLRKALQDRQRFQVMRTFDGSSFRGKGEIFIYRVKRRYESDGTLVGSSALASRRQFPS